jgi:hypothetical protein
MQGIHGLTARPCIIDQRVINVEENEHLPSPVNLTPLSCRRIRKRGGMVSQRCPWVTPA